MNKPKQPNFYDVRHDPFFEDFIVERNLKTRSENSYRNALNNYCNYHHMTLQELLDEADREEEERILERNRTLVKRLKEYRKYELQKGTKPSSLSDYLIKIKSFYRHFMIQIPYIPPLKVKRNQTMIEDLPRKQDLIEAIQHTSNLKHTAIIYFIASSGTGRQEVANLRVQDFIDATSEYHNGTNDVQDILKQLENQKDIIPVWSMTRQKTQYRYYTVSSGESTTHLIRYLKTRPPKTLRPTAKLFDIEPEVITSFLSRLNTKCRFPTPKNKALIHPHNIRRYHATTIQNKTLADRLQGRKGDSITEAYFKADPQYLKREYMKHIEDLTLQPSRVVTIESDEVKALKKQHQAEINKLKNEFQDRTEYLEHIVHELYEEHKRKK